MSMVLAGILVKTEDVNEFNKNFIMKLNVLFLTNIQTIGNVLSFVLVSEYQIAVRK